MATPHRSEGYGRDVRYVTYWALATNLTLSLVKFMAGVLGGSQALVADGVHSLSDMSTDLAVLIGVRYWTAPADSEHPHGHGRIETLITLFIGVLLAAVGGGLIYRAVVTMHGQHQAAPGWVAFGAACVSVVSKELLYRWTVGVGKRIKSSAVIANAWHQRSDALSSLPVALAVLGTRIHPAWAFLDHVAAVIVSVLIMYAALKIAWPALRQLLDAGADRQSRKTILSLAMGTEGVRAVHALRTRHIGPGIQADIHVMVAPELSVREGHAIAGAVKERILRDGPEVVDVLIHVEPHEPDGDSGNRTGNASDSPGQHHVSPSS